ncbi:MAG: glycosyltransferase [Candidatus Micrarchaeaceae archaeon]
MSGEVLVLNDARRLLVAVFIIFSSLLSISFAAYLLATVNSINIIIIGSAFLTIALIAAAYNTITAVWYYKSRSFKNHMSKPSVKQLSYFPSVGIAVPVYKENVKLVENTLSKLKLMNYPKEKMHIYLLDDSTDATAVNELRKFSAQNGIKYMHRRTRKGFKAGALNNFLKHSNEEFIAIFDADEYLANRNFLKDLLPYFSDESVGFVQTEKRYASGSFFANSINLLNGFFFKFIQPARSVNGTLIYAGSCALIRRSSIVRLGGFPEVVLEDTFFSFKAKLKGVKGVYIPKVYAFGRPMSKFTSFAKQQWRYNYGGTEFMAYCTKNIGSKDVRMMDRIDYLAHGFGLNYLSIMMIAFTILTIAIVFSGLPMGSLSISAILHPSQSQIALSAFFTLLAFTSLIGPLLVLREYFKSFKYGLMVMLLNFAVAFTRAEAALAAIFRIAPSWSPSWVKSHNVKGNFRNVLKNSFVEFSFASLLAMLAAVAVFGNNIAGAFWLAWYAALYGSTTVLLYKYG